MTANETSASARPPTMMITPAISTNSPTASTVSLRSSTNEGLPDASTGKPVNSDEGSSAQHEPGMCAGHAADAGGAVAGGGELAQHRVGLRRIDAEHEAPRGLGVGEQQLDQFVVDADVDEVERPGEVASASARHHAIAGEL